jgi:predicted ATPase
MLPERDRETALLGDLLASATSETGRVAVVLGEAGIGKSALVRSFLRAAGTSVRVLKGACEDFSIAEPLAPLRDLAREVGWELPDMHAQGSDRLSVFSAALDVLTDPAQTTAILVEDIHWADDATLDFLRYLARRLEDRKILLLLTARDDEREGQPRVRKVIGGLTSETVTRLSLGPLSRSVVASLPAGSGRDASAIYDLAGGNAFYVTGLLRGQEDGLPQSVRDSFLARAEGLGALSRRLLDAVSIFPGRAEKALVAGWCPRSRRQPRRPSAWAFWRRLQRPWLSATNWPAVQSRRPFPPE